MADGRHFENRKYAITRPRIVRSPVVRPNYIYIYIYIRRRRAGMSASAELLVSQRVVVYVSTSTTAFHMNLLYADFVLMFSVYANLQV